MIKTTERWVCDHCRNEGPEFTGTAESELPTAWLILDARRKLLDGDVASESCIALCVNCLTHVEDYADIFGSKR